MTSILIEGGRALQRIVATVAAAHLVRLTRASRLLRQLAGRRKAVAAE